MYWLQEIQCKLFNIISKNQKQNQKTGNDIIYSYKTYFFLRTVNIFTVDNTNTVTTRSGNCRKRFFKNYNAFTIRSKKGGEGGDHFPF